MNLKTLTILFKEVDLEHHHISEFRSYFNKELGYQEPLLHNHKEAGGEIYRYPRVQFRSVDSKAALFAMEEGVGLLKKLILSDFLPAALRTNIQIEEQETEIRMTDDLQPYHITHFLPLNAENYEIWKKEDDLEQRVALVKRATVGHLLNFCSEIGFRVPDKSLKIKLKRMDSRKSVKLRASGNEMNILCFDIAFETNLVLPPGISLGKGKSKGYGVVKKMKIDNLKSGQRKAFRERHMD